MRAKTQRDLYLPDYEKQKKERGGSRIAMERISWEQLRRKELSNGIVAWFTCVPKHRRKCSQCTSNCKITRLSGKWHEFPEKSFKGDDIW